MRVNPVLKLLICMGGVLLVLESLLLFHYGVINQIVSSIGFNNEKEIINSERADYWCIMGWQNTLKKMNYDAEICFFGNSLTYYSDFGSMFPEKRIVNLGYPGDDLPRMLVRVNQINAVHPDKVYYGGNK